MQQEKKKEKCEYNGELKTQQKKKKEKQERDGDGDGYGDGERELREFADKYPLVNDSLEDDLGEDGEIDLLMKYLMHACKKEVEELNLELKAFYASKGRLARKLTTLLTKQTHLVHIGIKAYRKYSASSSSTSTAAL